MKKRANDQKQEKPEKDTTVVEEARICAIFAKATVILEQSVTDPGHDSGSPFSR